MRSCQLLWLTWLSAYFVLCVGLTSLYFSDDESCSLLPLGLNSLLPCGIFLSVKHWVHIEVELGGYYASLDVEYQRDILLVLWGSPKVDPYTVSLHPLASFRSPALLDLIICHVHWASKVVHVFGVFLDVRLCEYGVRGSLVGIVKPGSGVTIPTRLPRTPSSQSLTSKKTPSTGTTLGAQCM